MILALGISMPSPYPAGRAPTSSDGRAAVGFDDCPPSAGAPGASITAGPVTAVPSEPRRMAAYRGWSWASWVSCAPGGAAVPSEPSRVAAYRGPAGTLGSPAQGV